MNSKQVSVESNRLGCSQADSADKCALAIMFGVKMIITHGHHHYRDLHLVILITHPHLLSTINQISIEKP